MSVPGDLVAQIGLCSPSRFAWRYQANALISLPRVNIGPHKRRSVPRNGTNYRSLADISVLICGRRVTWRLCVDRILFAATSNLVTSRSKFSHGHSITLDKTCLSLL